MDNNGQRSSEEEQSWEKEKPRYSIFSEEQKWFKCEKYEVYEYKERVPASLKPHVYIKPVDNAKVEQYNPYDKYPQILIDFFNVIDTMMNRLFELHPTMGVVGIVLSMNTPLGVKLNHQLLVDCANILLDFYNKYGPLGIFFEDISQLRRLQDNHFLVFTKQDTNFPRNRSFFSEDKQVDNERNGIYEYTSYAKPFFPWLKQVPDLFEESYYYGRLYDNKYNLSHEFMKNYSELITLILFHELIHNLLITIDTIKEFDEYGTQSDKTSGPGTLFLDVGFPGISHPILNTYMMTLRRDDKRIKIGWKANSLLGMLVLMFIENISKQRNDNITVCKLPECNRLAVGRAEYCCEKHGARYRQRKHRSKP